MDKALGPLNLTIEIPPSPGGVEMAAIVSSNIVLTEKIGDVASVNSLFPWSSLITSKLLYFFCLTGIFC